MAPVPAKSFFDMVSTEFNVATEDLLDLEIHDTDKQIQYFYDGKRTGGRALVKDFVLLDKSKTAIMVSATLVKRPEGCSPRLKFWIKDKSKTGQVGLEPNDLPDPAAVKGLVDTSKAHESLWKLIAFLQSFRGLVLPAEGYSIVPGEAAKLATLLKSENKGEALEAIRAALGSSLTDRDITLIANRKQELAEFQRLLNDSDYFAAHHEWTDERPEAVWQNFFERNRWIFGYGLNLIATDGLDEGKLERATLGNSVFAGAGNRIDALMRSRGYINTLLFCEIKRHDTDLLAKQQYRKPATYAPSWELVGGVAQVQKTTRRAIRQITTQMVDHIKPDGTPTKSQFNISRPRRVVVIGKLQEFNHEDGVNAEMMESFELFRTSVSDTEIVTYDELYQRARFIVED